MSGILRQWPLSLHRKTAKLLNMAPILPILKILQNVIKKYFINIVSTDIFCFIFFCKMETVHFF